MFSLFRKGETVNPNSSIIVLFQEQKVEKFQRAEKNVLAGCDCSSAAVD